MRVTLNGYVVNDDDAWIYEWFGYNVFSPAAIRKAIRENPAGEDLILEINSPGGSVFSGFEMYSVLRSAEGIRTRAEVQSLAASAASTLMLGCDEVLLSPVAQVMIHNPIVTTEGNQSDHRDSIRVLDSITESILNAYEAKSRGARTREQLRSMMARSTWMTAQEAMDAGLADGILWQEEANPMPESIINAVGTGIRALGGSGGLPEVSQLRSEYQRLQGAGSLPAGDPPAGDPESREPNDTASTGTEPEADSQDWREQARLDLEKNRFIFDGGML